LESLTDDFITFLFAGQETIANTLTTLFLEIGKNKSIFMKAREEIDRVLGERNEITYQDAVDLKYCNCIFKETLRLFPPVTMISREPTEDFFINEYKIPKGTFLVVIIEDFVKIKLEIFKLM
jgi:cytochrome P450